MNDVPAVLDGLLTPGQLLSGEAISEDYSHDEALTVPWTMPDVVARPRTTDEVAAILRAADAAGVPVTARGSGTGLSGACVPTEGGILLSLEDMAEIIEIDTANHVAVVQPGVTLGMLDDATRAHGLIYPISPGETSASLGGNVATNAGGMRAVKYGVTRNQVLGLEAVLASGEVIRTGGKFVKATTGYDLTQLIIGSEGTLAVVTEVTLKLQPRREHQQTVLVPFATMEQVTRAVPLIIASGVGPLMLEYIDMLTMSAITASAGLELGIPTGIREEALAYLVVVMESMQGDRLDEDVQAVAELATELGAMDVYVLPPSSATGLIEAREKAHWVGKAHGSNDIVDVVVPRAAVPDFLETVQALAREHESLIAGCGHAGDGNVHFSVFQPDDDRRYELMRELFRAGMGLGGVISAEHGIGTEKRKYFLELEDPVKIDLMRRIKSAFDPNGTLNPGTLLD